MATELTGNYEPPLRDPQEEGLKHWDQLRAELMTTRDMLRAVTVDNEVKARRIDDLTEQLKVEKNLSLRARNEVIALRTSLENIGRMLIGILKEGRLAGREEGPYQPPVVPTNNQGAIDDIANMLDLSKPVPPPVHPLTGKVPEFLVKANNDDAVINR